MVRPGRPNKAASSFVSGILREPLLGEPADLPVPDAFKVWICSPRRAVDWLLHAASMPTADLGPDRGINPPGMSVSVADMLAALDRVRRVPDPVVAAIVGGWPAAFAPKRAQALGFGVHEPLDDLLMAFIEDDLDATRRDRAV